MMKTHRLRFACVALVLVSLVTVLSLATATYALTRLPTTLTAMLAVRTPSSGCHTRAAVAVTRTLKVLLTSDQQGQIRLQVERGQGTSPSANQGLGDPPVMITARPVRVVDNSAILHRPVAPSRFGMVVARVNVPC